MSIFQIENKKSIENLFEGWQESMIWSCLQGCMGHAWAEKANNPESAQIIIGDFYFFAGKPNAELILNTTQNFVIMVPQNKDWEIKIEEVYKDKAKKIIRYATKKEPDVFDIDKLQKMAENIKPPYKLQMIDNEIYKQMMVNKWSEDLCSQFISYDDYQNRGMGFVVTEKGTAISGASSYIVYNSGIEIEIDTREDHRRKGFASACGAKLILECLGKGLYPSWDAHNKASAALAEKLGYHLDKPYTAYEVEKFI